MDTYTEPEFYDRLDYACRLARSCEVGSECMRIAIDDAGLPIPIHAFNGGSDDELAKVDPIYGAVAEISAGKVSVVKTLSLAKHAWQYYLTLTSEQRRVPRGIGYAAERLTDCR